MPTDDKTPNNHPDHNKHLEQLPEKDQELLRNTGELINNLCPGCQLRIISLFTATSLTQYPSEQRLHWLKDLMKAALIISTDLESAEEDDEKNATRH